MTPAAKTRLVCQIGQSLGFDRVGVTSAKPLPDAAYYRDWLAKGYAGSMAYLSRHQDLRANPALLLDGAKSIICTALSYHRPPNASAPFMTEPTGRIASYARGKDYHLVIHNLLDQFTAELRQAFDDPFDARAFVDTGPLLERSLAATAGLGWIGKNTLLMHHQTGSYLFLGELITTLDLEPTEPLPDHCGTCTRCLEACPTKAFPAPYKLDASRCISYFTIEHRGEIPPDIQPELNDWIFGCDICQEVCPHNARAPLATLPAICTERIAERIPLRQWARMDADQYRQLTHDSALSRARLPMMQRNAAIALNNVLATSGKGMDKPPLQVYHAPMQIPISKCAQTIAPSATLALQEKITQLRRDGVQVIAFGAGEPDFDTPAHIVTAANAALAKHDTRYAPVAGKPELRDAIAAYLKQYCSLTYARQQVCVTVGTKDALHLGFRVLLDPGDEVIIPAPYWLSYPDQVRLAGGVPVIIPCTDADAFKLTPAALKNALTPRTRVLVINSPSNPSGAVYSAAEQEALAAVLRATGVSVVSDEIYHRLVYGPHPFVSFAALPGMYDRTLTVSGVGKTFAMTGWRLGFAAGPAHVISAMSRMQGQTTSGATTFVQTAAIAALSGDQACVAQMLDAYRKRAQVMTAGLNALPGIRCTAPHGAFYCFANISEACDRLGCKDADEFATRLLEQVHVAVVSGVAFGAPRHVRMSFATSDANITEGLKRLTVFLAG